MTPAPLRGTPRVPVSFRRALPYRRVFVVALHILMVVGSNQLGFWLRFDGHVPQEYVSLMYSMLPWLVAMRIAAFLPLRLFEGLWRYTSLWDVRNIILGVLGSSAAFALIVRYGFGSAAYPRTVYVMDAILLIAAMTTARLTRRLYREFMPQVGGRRILIYGASDTGDRVARDLLQESPPRYELIGFIDDDPTKRGRSIRGVRVLGTRAALPDLMRRLQPDDVLIAIPSAPPQLRRAILESLEPFKVRIATIADTNTEGQVSTQIRAMRLEDLLSRPAVGLDPARLRTLVTGKRVLVTGAGTIGSELSRQIAALNPATLVLFDRYENSLYDCQMELLDRGTCPLETVVADMTDAGRVAEVFESHRPHVVFHAAAHKHVPLMETNVCEAVKNNVRGSRILMEASDAHGVERFVLISSDKAVNPLSVMGATKRVGELLMQRMAARSATRFVTVRFGNVLGSNGSVVPRFLEQIRRGGPVTITDPGMRRYFMLVPEAVQLVLHAAALNKQGALFVLEMGEQLRVADLARTMIGLAGLVPDEDIQITVSGLRPGEKLAEELTEAGEELMGTAIENVLQVRLRVGARRVDADGQQLSELERAAARGDAEAAIAALAAVVPTFRAAARPRLANAVS